MLLKEKGEAQKMLTRLGSAATVVKSTILARLTGQERPSTTGPMDTGLTGLTQDRLTVQGHWWCKTHSVWHVMVHVRGIAPYADRVALISLPHPYTQDQVQDFLTEDSDLKDAAMQSILTTNQHTGGSLDIVDLWSFITRVYLTLHSQSSWTLPSESF